LPLPAPLHDSQKLDDLLDPVTTASPVWADSAYRSREAEAKLAARGLKSRIHRRVNRGKPLAARKEAANKTRSSARAGAEHVFGSQHTSMGGKLGRTTGIARARMKIGIQNPAYNMRRLIVLGRAMPA
jgi:IS5 family transposase